ncbi:MAG: glycosyltransferase family 4 protein [Gemmatimonadales bacterium]
MKPRIALDFTHLDSVSPASGQYRYVVALVHGLAELAPDAAFVLFGSRPDPAPELAGVFSTGRWTYRRLEPASGVASTYRDQLRYATALGREHVDLLHSLHSFIPILAPCPVVVTVCDLMFELFPEYAQAVHSRPYRIYRWAARHRARRLVAISQTTADDVARLWRVDPGRIDVVPLATRMAGPDQPRRASSGARPLIVAPYNLEPRKNLDALLAAAAILTERYPTLDVALFGRGGLTPEREVGFESRLRALGLESAVRRTGVISDEVLWRLYQEADVFVFPSLYEGFGLPVLEAMAAGACVLVRGASAMRDIVAEAGATVETSDPAATAVAIGALLDAPARRREMGERARHRAATFTVRRMAEGTWRSYCTALGRAQEV